MKSTSKVECSTQNLTCKKALMTILALLLVATTVYVVFLIRNEHKKFDYIGQTDQRQNQITISGEAQVVAVPDVAKIDLSVISNDFNVTTAQTQNTEKMNSIISAMKGLGIEEKDLKTTSYNIYPEYDWSENGRVFKGYKITQSVEVIIRDTKKVSEVLAVAGNLKVDTIGNLRFEVEDVETVKQEARVLAIENAKEKAQELADSLDVKLGKIVNFNESGNYPQPVYLDYAKSEVMGLGEVGEMPQIQTGESEIQANVSITFEIL